MQSLWTMWSLLVVMAATAAVVANRQYADLNLNEIERQFALLAEHSSFIKVSDAEAMFRLPPVSWRKVTCSPLIVRATDHRTLQRDNERPQVLLSGALHGDERVGPVVVVETIRLLVQAALCDAPQQSSDVFATGFDGVCNATDARTRDWLWHLLTTRDIYAVPAANCAGYALRERTERHIDPNRDFPFEQSPKKCMLTTTARVMNELWRENLFQLAVTFHGGMEAISWVWGSPSHSAPNDASPDEVASAQLGHALRLAAGKTAWGAPYQIGRMSSIVYPVAGGMEDWAYGASWAHAQQPCQSQYYSPERTIYDKGDPSFRTAIYLVESSNQKSPSTNRYGQSEELFVPHMSAGHVSRDIRLALMALEMAQPYLCFDALTVNHHGALRGAGPMLDVAWYVGGALRVEDTFLTLQRAAIEVQNCTEFGSNNSCHPMELQKFVYHNKRPISGKLLNNVATSNASSSKSRRHVDGSGWKNPLLTWDDAAEMGGFPSTPKRAGPHRSLFSASVDVLSRTHTPGLYWVVAWARVDQAWSQPVANAQPVQRPQTHFANSRTNVNWFATKGDRKVKGRLYWASAPLTIRVTQSRSIEVVSWMLRCRHLRHGAPR